MNKAKISSIYKILSTILSATLILALLNIGCITANADYSGTTGNVTWTFNQTTKQLTVSGTGKMASYENNAENIPPWTGCKDLIEKVVIGDGITNVGAWSFASCTNLKEIVIGNSVTDIETYAFYSCNSIKEFSIGSSLTNIGMWASWQSSIKYVYYAGNVNQIFIDYGNTPIKSAKWSDHKHIFAEEATSFPADCIHDGYTGKACALCDVVDDKVITTKHTGHNIVDGVCTKCGKTVLIYTFDKDSPEDYVAWDINVPGAKSLTLSVDEELDLGYTYYYVYDGNTVPVDSFDPGTGDVYRNIEVSGDSAIFELYPFYLSEDFVLYVTADYSEESLFGDLDVDMDVDADDLILMNKAVLFGEIGENYDLNTDGSIDLIDLVILKKVIAGAYYK